MIEKVCLKVKDEDKIICNESWYKGSNKEPGSYEVVVNKVVSCMEDLIQYCLTYNYEIDIPSGYKVIEVYSILFATGNFEPESRTCSSVSSSIIFSSTNLKHVQEKFKAMCKQVGKNSKLQNDHYYCWHTEDFASNQVIHSYNINKSYIVTKI